MKTFAFGFAAAVALGLASLSAPASAATTTQTKIVAPMTDVSSQGYVSRRTVVRRGPFCTTRVTRTRGPMGRVVVRKVRVCR